MQGIKNTNHADLFPNVPEYDLVSLIHSFGVAFIVVNFHTHIFERDGDKLVEFAYVLGFDHRGGKGINSFKVRYKGGE